MKPPKSVKVGPFTYTIERDDAVAARQAAVLGFDILGYTDNPNLAITLTEGLPGDLERETVLHEVMHAIFATSGARDLIVHDGNPENRKKDDPYGLEERVIRGLCTHLYGVLRDNPRLVAYLLAD